MLEKEPHCENTAGDSDRRIIVALIDDSESDLAITTRFLRKLPNWECEVRAFLDPDVALQTLPGQEIHVVLSDFHMGKWTGLGLLEELCARGQSAPFVLLTGEASVDIAAQSMHAGVADFFPKDSLSVESLARSITSIVQKDRVQKELVSTRDELACSVDLLRRRTAEIESFYHSVCHELKTPLTSAREFVSLVRDRLAGPLNDEQFEFLTIAIRNHDRIVVCMNDMLDATRVETGKISCNASPYAVVPLLDELRMTWGKRAVEADIGLTFSYEDNLPQLCVDEVRFNQILNNLIGNALKFTGAGGEVRVQCHRIANDSKFLEIQVSDTGRGIPEEKLDRIFDRLFQTAEEDACLQGGLGLGLYISKELAHLHGGELSVESTEGTGSTFSLTLPIHDETPSPQKSKV